MSVSRSHMSLRNLLLVDAATCTVMGTILALGPEPVGVLTAIPPALLFYAGLSLFPVAAFMAFVATRRSVSTFGAWLIIAGNGLWVAASLFLLVPEWIAPNALGVALIVGQAVAVVVLTGLEYAGLRDTPRAIRI